MITQLYTVKNLIKELEKEVKGLGSPDVLVKEIIIELEKAENSIDDEIINNERTIDELEDSLEDYEDDIYDIRNEYTCDILYELTRRRKDHPELLIADNLRDQLTVDILKEFFNKYSLEEIQKIQKIHEKGVSSMTDDLKDQIDELKDEISDLEDKLDDCENERY